MADTIRNNFHKVPHDVDFVLGIPRCGIISASIISEILSYRLVKNEEITKKWLFQSRNSVWKADHV